ncbi:hypothetical protein [Thalassolituus sp.]|jgi:hypothetical protein|uniref:hypothetical protein n=1 Tax=Thalassolituus sp. TaxID=2030822 RepID=UPI0026317198|nr:hypothetical protein [uncultured Thalassolituus sp.]
MDMLIALAALILFTVVPVMLSARLMGARYPRFGRSLLAVIAAALAHILALYALRDPLIAHFLALFLTAVIFAALLGAKIVQAFFIAVVAVIIQVLIGFGLAAMGIAFEQMF